MSYSPGQPGPDDDWSAWNGPTDPLTQPTTPARRPNMPQSQLPSRAAGPQVAQGAGSRVDGARSAAPVAPHRPMGMFGFDDTSPLPPGVLPPLPPSRKRNASSGKRRRPRWRRIVGYTVLALVILALILGGLGLKRAYDFGAAISPQGPLTSQTGYMGGNGRINIVVLSYGGAGHDGALLTDSMLVMSLIPGDHATTLISVPRDLWVQVPPNSGQYSKINTAYQDGYYNGYNNIPAGRLAGGAEAAQKVSEVTGLDVKYWVTIDFNGFRKLVDALGGVDITVPVAFTARYPINDDPAINAGWKIIHFNKGPQHMNGEQAIEYARARYVLDPLSEASDFARSARQQLLIRAILGRARSVTAWPGLLPATDALQQAMYTNLSLADLGLFAEKMDFNNAAHVGLTDQNVLVDSQSSDGQDILLPADSWDAVHQYVAQNLKN